jgi:hypothetical protein
LSQYASFLQWWFALPAAEVSNDRPGAGIPSIRTDIESGYRMGRTFVLQRSGLALSGR